MARLSHKTKEFLITYSLAITVGVIAFFAVVLILLFCEVAMAQSPQVPEVKIKNFGQMDDRFYRGAQPTESDYKNLAALGVTTIIDLRNDPKPYAKQRAESVGMRYVHIPMNDKSYPDESSIAQFLRTVDDPATGKFYVHCAGGRHRTGVMGAIYRFHYYGWSYDEVYKEMKSYDFYTRWGHGDLKKYVQDYSQRAVK